MSSDNVTYTFTADITDSIVVERDNIIIDGAGYTLQGTGAYESKGIALTGRSNVTIRNMEINAFYYGIWLWSSSNSSIIGNNITANGYDGIWLEGSSNNVVSGSNITANENGIRLSGSSNNIFGNNIANNLYGIWFYGYSSLNSIFGNTITNNHLGFYFRDSSNNSIFGNNIANSVYGIWLDYSSYNSISGNNITANDLYGIWIYYSSRNIIYHNNFVNNRVQADIHDPYPMNVWDDGYPSGGNYWSDYTGVDEKSGPNQDQQRSDGIGDTPYTIDANNIDRSPLMAPFSMFEAGTWNNVTYYVDMITNSTISDFNFDQDRKMINLNVTGPEGTDGFSRVSIPKKLLWCESLEEWRVHINGIELPIGWRPTILEDDNYTYIYIPYWHPTSQSIPIQIEGTYAIPEFPPAILLPLLMILSIIAVVFAERKFREGGRGR
jgi:parallel beta-helix repeat protein